MSSETGITDDSPSPVMVDLTEATTENFYAEVKEEAKEEKDDHDFSLSENSFSEVKEEKEEGAEEKDDHDFFGFKSLVIPATCLNGPVFNLTPFNLNDVQIPKALLPAVAKAENFSIHFSGEKKNGYIRFEFKEEADAYSILRKILFLKDKIKSNLKACNPDSEKNILEAYNQNILHNKKIREGRSEELNKICVYVNNLPPDTSETALKAKFPECDQVLVCKGRAVIGQAVLKFHSTAEAAACVKKYQKVLVGRNEVKLSRNPADSPFLKRKVNRRVDNLLKSRGMSGRGRGLPTRGFGLPTRGFGGSRGIRRGVPPLMVTVSRGMARGSTILERRGRGAGLLSRGAGLLPEPGRGMLIGRGIRGRLREERPRPLLPNPGGEFSGAPNIEEGFPWEEDRGFARGRGGRGRPLPLLPDPVRGNTRGRGGRDFPPHEERSGFFADEERPALLPNPDVRQFSPGRNDREFSPDRARRGYSPELDRRRYTPDPDRRQFSPDRERREYSPDRERQWDRQRFSPEQDRPALLPVPDWERPALLPNPERGSARGRGGRGRHGLQDRPALLPKPEDNFDRDRSMDWDGNSHDQSKRQFSTGRGHQDYDSGKLPSLLDLDQPDRNRFPREERHRQLSSERDRRDRSVDRQDPKQGFNTRPGEREFEGRKRSHHDDYNTGKLASNLMSSYGVDPSRMVDVIKTAIHSLKEEEPHSKRGRHSITNDPYGRADSYHSDHHGSSHYSKSDSRDPYSQHFEDSAYRDQYGNSERGGDERWEGGWERGKGSSSGRGRLGSMQNTVYF